MKNVRVLVESYVYKHNTYRVMQFDSETEEEKKFGECPLFAVHSSYKESDLPLNGIQLMVSKDFAELRVHIMMDSERREFTKNNPNASDMELMMFLSNVYDEIIKQ